MDLGTLVGIILGMAMIIGGILVGGGSLLLYWDLPSVFITIIGSYAALMVASPLSRALGIMNYINITFRVSNYETEKIIRTLVEFSERARREGLLALEDNVQDIEDPFMRRGVQLVVDGTDPEIIKSILYTELTQLQGRHNIGIKLIDNWGKLAPAFGMIGTLIGLIAMLGNLEDKSSIGKGMGVALITTMYGAILANLVFIPWKAKLEDKNDEESQVKEIVIEGILSIQSGDNPRILLDKLTSFLPPKQREALKSDTGKE